MLRGNAWNIAMHTFALAGKFLENQNYIPNRADKFHMQGYIYVNFKCKTSKYWIFHFLSRRNLDFLLRRKKIFNILKNSRKNCFLILWNWYCNLIRIKDYVEYVSVMYILNKFRSSLVIYLFHSQCTYLILCSIKSLNDKYVHFQ